MWSPLVARVPVSARGSGRPSALPGQPTNLHPTHPFWSWNFLNSLSKFSCSWRYTAGSLFNIFAILRLCHFHITFTAFSGETKAICVSRGFGGPLLHLMKSSAA